MKKLNKNEINCTIYGFLAALLCLTFLALSSNAKAVATYGLTDEIQAYLDDLLGWTTVKPIVLPQGVVFSEDFDDHPDWQVADGSEECNGIVECDSTIPTNWTYVRNVESWHPDDGTNATKQPGQKITSEQRRGDSGKAWVRTHESVLDPETQFNTFQNDTLLIKDLGQDYQELYAQFYIKFDPSWEWMGDNVNNTGNTGILKLFRFYHFDGPDGVAEPWKFFTDGDSGPIVIYDLKVSPVWGYRGTYAFRCDPQETEYYCSEGHEGDSLFSGTTISTPFSEIMGDGQWHKLKFRVKMNSAIGSADGIFQVWMDDEIQFDFTNINWRKSGSDLENGWNTVGFGGNTTNWFDDPANKSEQWYAIDDIIISTEDIQ